MHKKFHELQLLMSEWIILKKPTRNSNNIIKSNKITKDRTTSKVYKDNSNNITESNSDHNKDTTIYVLLL